MSVFRTYVHGQTIDQIHEEAVQRVVAFFGQPMNYRLTSIEPHTTVGSGGSATSTVLYEATVTVDPMPWAVYTEDKE